MTRRFIEMALAVAGAVFLVTVPWSIPALIDNFWVSVITEILIWSLFAASVNLLFGYVGLLSFGHAAFFGSAAYVTAHTVKVWGLPPELGILAGAAVATLVGAVFGWLAIRRQGIYFAMITLALAQMVYFVALQARYTGGETSYQGVKR